MTCAVAPYDTGCGVCGKTLVGRQRRWCSAAHAKVYADNHYWPNARRAAKRRDRNACVVRIALASALGLTLVPCGGEGLEVNHIDPRNGAGYGPGCHHHLDNLETLCHAHHVVETNKQRKARSAISNA